VSKWIVWLCQDYITHLWRLKPSTTKTVSSIFHLQNTSAARELHWYFVHMEGPHGRKITPAWSKPGVPWCYRHHLTKIAGKLQSGTIFWWNLLGAPGVPMLTRWGHLLWLSATLWQNIAAQYGTTLHMSVLSMLNWIPPCALYPVPFGQPLYHGCQFSLTLNLQLYDAELLQTSC